MNSTREPVAIQAAIQSLIIAFLVLVKVFGWWHWNDDQEAAILGIYATVVVVLGAIFTRSKVTPVP